MVSKIQIFISIAISTLFFIAGFNFSNYLNVQSPNSQYAQLGSILGGIGAGSSMLNLIRSWLLEDRKTPKLVDDGVIQYNVPDFYLLKLGKQYFLRIKNEKPNTIAKSVRGFITIDGTKVNYKPLVWENNRQVEFNIGYKGDLFLFSIEEGKTEYKINIPSILSENREETIEFYQEKLTFADSKVKEITIRIDSENAIAPKKYFTTTLEELFSKAKKKTESTN
jgi:hypothetical protein